MFDLDERRKKIAELESWMAEPGFWDDPQRAQEVVSELKEHKEWVEAFEELEGKCRDLEELAKLVDEEDAGELEGELRALEEEIRSLELRRMLSGEDDPKDALLTIHPGAGGTESMDWAEMLLRMYVRWIERKGFRGEVIDLQPGEEAGIKSATVEVKGPYAYGHLKAESGVHRLVRISPFDANHRRHTSFAAVFVYPEVDEDLKVEIRPEDVEVDTFHASGPGGQNVNKVETGVRITHIPTGITVQCQSERSQYQNRMNAMKMLKARLYQYYKEQEQKKREELESSKKRIEWGNQIRSYVLHPYKLVKDLRTGAETSDVERVLDGDIDQFIRAYLSSQVGEK
ncbi:MAG TPA: peptide chain release factor 2 [Candidatus Latescibacteria bacterium]|nr:peptide chain release factor 2 [Candidatus Latescibacterota bacterium]